MRSKSLVTVNVCQQLELSSVEDFVDCSEQQFVDIVNLCFAEYAPKQTTIELCFMSEQQHCAAHEQFLNDSSATDVIAFPYNDEDCHGEVLVNVEMAVRRAPEFAHSAVHELMLYVVHGTLHLLGFDDHLPQDIEDMRVAEQNILQQAIAHNIF
jgi:probable rRNA maturation factor